MDLAVDVALRLLGAFYVIGCTFGLRTRALDRLLTEAIGAIAAADPREQAAERQRGRWLVVSLLMVGLGGVALLALLDIAVWLFLGSLGFYVVYLLVLAPRLDQADPPDERGLSQRRNALWSYLAATVVVVIAWTSDRLQSVDEAHHIVLLGAAALAAGLAFYAVRLDRSSRLDSVGRFPLGGGDAGSAEPDGPDHSVLPVPVIMRPSWDKGAFFDEQGHPVDLQRFVDFTEADLDDVARWLAIVTEVVDATDPYRCALKDPDGVRTLDAAGRSLFERIRERMGEGQIVFDPCPAPVAAQHEAKVIKLMADWPCHPLWILDDDRCDPIDPATFGLSVQLARAIGDWEVAAPRYDHEAEGGGPVWSEEDFDAHEESGRVLAIRIARELRQSGREHVTVYAFRRSTGVVAVRADDPIEA